MWLCRIFLMIRMWWLLIEFQWWFMVNMFSSFWVGCWCMLLLVLMIDRFVCFVRNCGVLVVECLIIMMLGCMVVRLCVVFDRFLFFLVEEWVMVKLMMFVLRCLVVILKLFWVWVEFLKNRFSIVIFFKVLEDLFGVLLIVCQCLVCLKIREILMGLRLVIEMRWWCGKLQENVVWVILFFNL